MSKINLPMCSNVFPLISDCLGSVYLSTHCSFLALNSTTAIKPLFSDNIVIFSNFSSHCSIVESVQDFLIKLDMKPCMHLVEISIFSLNLVIVRLTKIMNRADKNCGQKLGTKLENKVS